MNVSTEDFAELSGFRRDLLIVIGGLNTPKGLEIKTELEQYYDDTIHHGRLYPNLDTLTEQGLVEKIAVNNRSNGYNLTDLGEAHIQARRKWETNRTSSPDTETANIPTELGNKPTKHPDTEQPESNEPTNAAPHMGSLPNGRVDTLTVTVLDYDTDPESNHVARLQVKLQDGTELPLDIWHDLELDWVVGAKYTIEQAQHKSWEGNTGTDHKLNSTKDFHATRIDTNSSTSAPDPDPKKDKHSSDAPDTEETEPDLQQRDLVISLVKLAQELGHLPNPDEINERGKYRYQRYQEEFGNLYNACQEAGILPDDVTIQDFHGEEALEPVEEADDINSDPKTKSTSQSTSDPAVAQGIDEAAVELKESEEIDEADTPEAKLDETSAFNSDVDRPSFHGSADIDASEMISEIQLFADIIDEPPTKELVVGYGKYPADEYRTAFGSWDAALEAAGFDPEEMPDWSARSNTNVEILDGIRLVAEKLGHAPTTTETEKHVDFSPGLATLRFGSWSDALETAGLDPSERPSVQDSGAADNTNNRKTDGSIPEDDDDKDTEEQDSIQGVIEETLEDMLSSSDDGDSI